CKSSDIAPAINRAQEWYSSDAYPDWRGLDEDPAVDLPVRPGKNLRVDGIDIAAILDDPVVLFAALLTSKRAANTR
ncbi:MAG: hypothetical protein M3R60_14165, partial [Pseudomonadota bacterium]|nr:hypothetical protein [Pseudomonadota bacterium]